MELLLDLQKWRGELDQVVGNLQSASCPVTVGESGVVPQLIPDKPICHPHRVGWLVV